MKTTRSAGGADALLEVDGRAPLLVHDADLQGVRSEAEGLLHPGKERHRGCHLFRSVHLRPDDVDAAGAAVREGTRAFQVVHRGERSHHRVEESLRDRLPALARHRVGVHVGADDPDQEQTPARQRQALAVGGGVVTVGGEATGDLLAAFLEARLESAPHDTEPVAVDERLVLGVDRGDRVFAILDCRDCRFQHHVIHSRGVQASHGVGGVDVDFDVQSVVAEQHAFEGVTRHPVPGETLGIDEAATGSPLELHSEFGARPRP